LSAHQPRPAGKDRSRDFDATVRIDTGAEAAYYRDGGNQLYIVRYLHDDAWPVT